MAREVRSSVFGRRGRVRFVALALGLLGVVTASACSDSDSGANDESGSTSTAGPKLAAPKSGCDDLDTTSCLMPFPSNFHTRLDESSATGRRVDLAKAAMPRNASGVAIDPTEWNRNDGFSTGTPLTTRLVGVDLTASKVPDITDPQASLADDSPLVVLNARTGERHPVWAEFDSTTPSASDPAVVVHPARPYDAGATYVIAWRSLVDRNGEPIVASPLFQAFRDKLATGVDAHEDRRAEFDDVFAALASAGVERESVQLAWDFTIASEESTTGRLLAIRDDAFATLGADEAPPFRVTEVIENSDTPERFREVVGTFDVPLYLTNDGAPGEGFQYPDGAGPDATPQRNGDAVMAAPFRCVIPRSLAAGGAPGAGVVYGHGLLGSNNEVRARNIALMTEENRLVYCATNWSGMSEDDVAHAITTLGDLSLFPSVADRLQQGVLNTLMLGRLMRSPTGLAADPAFSLDGRALLAAGSVTYDGNSQGGIMGLVATAVSQEWTRAVLGVPGMNYSLLLTRSVDWDTYSAVLYPAYPDENSRAVLLPLLQMLWDRGEGAGYVTHVTSEPFRDTPAHEVLLHVAYGDHQVSMWAAEIEARALDVGVVWPALAAGRHPDVEPYWGIEHIARFPHTGSAMVVWDSGTPAPPTTATPPREGEDPHEFPRLAPAARLQKAEFLRSGTVIDVCSTSPCLAPAA
jgi:hypothetical protein